LIFRNFIQFVVYTNCWISVGAAALAAQYYLFFEQEVDYGFLFFLFFGTQLTYIFQRLVKLNHKNKHDSPRLRWMKRNPIISRFFLFLSLGGCLFLLFFFPPEILFFLAVLGFISFFYIRKFPGEKGKNLRDIPHLKIYLIAIVWAVSSSFLPAFLAEQEWNNNLILLFLANFLYIIAITIPFDIRDLHLDEREKQTIPQLLGVKKAKILAVILAAGAAVLLYALNSNFVPALIAILGVTSALVLYSRPKHKDLYYSFGVDGLLPLQFVLLLLNFLLLS
jgi:4-hydroxybenzoate polyprenyltransferase